MVLLRLLSLSFLIETVKTTGGCNPIVTIGCADLVTLLARA